LELKYGNSTKFKISSSGIDITAGVSMGTNNISGIGTATATKISVGGSSDLTYSSSKLQISTDTNVSGSIACSGALECATARIKVGTRDFYPTTGAYDSSKYYLRS
jgi:hypothetical protein